MPRLLILILPLLLLWFAFSAKQPEAASSVELQSRSESRILHSDEFSEGHRSTRRGSEFSTLEVPISPLVLPGALSEAEKIQNSQLSHARKIDLVWSHLDAGELLGPLSSVEKDELRSYVSELLSGEKGVGHWLCWGPETQSSKALAFHQVEKFTGLAPSTVSLLANQFLGSGRWRRVATFPGSTLTQGLPVTVTWSIVPDGTIAPGSQGQEAAPSNLRSWLAGIYGNVAGQPVTAQPWFPILEAAFEAVGETCGVQFVYEPDDDGVIIAPSNVGFLGTRGDIRLAARSLDGNSGLLGFAFSPDYGDVVFDSADSFFNNTTSNSLGLFNAVTHEVSHAMGLAHVCPLNGTKLMEPLLTRGFRGPRFDEFQSLQRQYGDVLEYHSLVRNNDSFLNAAPITLLADATKTISRLSIDDNSDRDYYRFSVLEGQKLTVSLVPGAGTYREGAQVGENCSAGTDFNSSEQHKLSIKLLDTDGTTVLVSSDAAGLGEVETLPEFLFPAGGDYYLFVEGDSSNAAQLYDLNLTTVDRPPAARFRLVNTTLMEESGVTKNSQPDPGETIRLTVEVENIGNSVADNLQVSADGPASLTVFSATPPEDAIAVGGTGAVELILNSGVTSVLSFDLFLGDIVPDIPIDVDFDDSVLLPSGWASSTSGAGTNWAVSAARSDSPALSVFAAGISSVSEAILVSSEVTLGGDGGTLTFRHRYLTENGWDGGVLEYSRDDGAWLDLPESSAEVVTGGYNATIRSSSEASIRSRSAWSGDSENFVTTTVKLPANWAGSRVRFRWLLAHDRSSSREGWYLDNIVFTTTTASCVEHRPVLNLTAAAETLAEGSQVNLNITTDLPLVSSLDFTLESSGTATSDDLDSPLEGSFAAGQAEQSFPLSALVDGMTEGEETLVLNLTSAANLFEIGEASSVDLVISESSGFVLWSTGFFGSAVDPLGDSDGDNFSELAEYLLGTDPTSTVSVISLSVTPENQTLFIPLGTLPDRADAVLGVEKSDNLDQWLPASITISPDGIRVPRTGAKSFLRLTFSLSE